MGGEECWGACGYKGGHCPSFCGEDGYCCRAGYPGCPSYIRNYRMTNNFHSCIKSHSIAVGGGTCQHKSLQCENPTKNLGKECLEACGSTSGHCPNFCGVNGYCCRVGFPGCSNIISKYWMSTSFHSCVEADRLSVEDCDITHRLSHDNFKVVI